MPFYLYEHSGSEMEQVRQVALGGNQGPFACHVRDRLQDGATAPIEWHLTEKQMLKLLEIDRPEQHALIVDLKPKAEGNVSLYRITDAWGHTKPHWTPLALRMQTLFADRRESDPDAFQEQFELPEGDGDLVHEFLYLTAGTESDSWNWGRTGSVNAALLWPSTFRYFIEAMTEDLDWEA